MTDTSLDTPRDSPHDHPGRTRRALAVLLGVGVASAATIAALVSTGAPSHARGAHLPPRSSPQTTAHTTALDPLPATAQQNKALASAEAIRLAEVALPHGAAIVAAIPDLHPALGMAPSAQLIVVTHYYRFPFDMAQAAAWFSRHPPHGAFSATARGGTGQATTIFGLSWDERPGKAWDIAQIQVSFAPESAKSSFVRVDGAVRWHDPTPVRDTSTGQRVRVTVTGGCPTSDRHVADVTNDPSAELERQLVPAVAPTGELICHYDGGNGTPFGLVGQLHLTGAAAAADAKRFRDMPVGRHGAGVTN